MEIYYRKFRATFSIEKVTGSSTIVRIVLTGSSRNRTAFTRCRAIRWKTPEWNEIYCLCDTWILELDHTTHYVKEILNHCHHTYALRTQVLQTLLHLYKGRTPFLLRRSADTDLCHCQRYTKREESMAFHTSWWSRLTVILKLLFHGSESLLVMWPFSEVAKWTPNVRGANFADVLRKPTSGFSRFSRV